MRAIKLFVASTLIFFVVIASSEEKKEKVIKAKRTNETIKIDGFLEEEI